VFSFSIYVCGFDIVSATEEAPTGTQGIETMINAARHALRARQ